MGFQVLFIILIRIHPYTKKKDLLTSASWILKAQLWYIAHHNTCLMPCIQYQLNASFMWVCWWPIYIGRLLVYIIYQSTASSALCVCLLCAISQPYAVGFPPFNNGGVVAGNYWHVWLFCWSKPTTERISNTIWA